MREMFEVYTSQLQGISELRILPPQSEEWIPWFIDIFTEKRDALAFFLKQHNVQTRPVYPSIHDTDPYKVEGEFPTSTYVSSHGLFLPSHLLLTDEQIEFICLVIRMFFT